MKKILLSSIIMLGVCGAVNAQTGSKFKKNEVSTSTGSAAAPATPQKAANMPESDVQAAATPETRTAADKQAAQTAPVSRGKAKEQAKQQQAQQAQASVNAAGVVVPSEEEKIKADKADKAKAAGENDKRPNQ